MAFGDKWRISGAIPIFNPKFLRDDDYDFAASTPPTNADNIPDGWMKRAAFTQSGNVNGTMQVQLCQGFSDDRAVRIFNQAGVGLYNEFVSLPTDPGTFPQRAASTGFDVYVRCQFWYFASALSAVCLPFLEIWDAYETTSLTYTWPSISVLATSAFAQYDATLQMSANSVDLGFVPDHVRFGWRMGNVASPGRTYVFDDLVLSFSLTNPGLSTAYDTMETAPFYRDDAFTPVIPGTFERATQGHMRYHDLTGAATRNRIAASFPALTAADLALLRLCQQLHAGAYSAHRLGGTLPAASPLMASCPIVVEPFRNAPPGNQWGKTPHAFYAYLVDLSDARFVNQDRVEASVVIEEA